MTWPIILVTIITLIRVQAQQQAVYCPKSCKCDEDTLETICKEPFGNSGLPHTLSPRTKKIIINNAHTKELSSTDLGYFQTLEVLDLAHNKITLLDLDHIKSNVNLISLNTSHNSIFELKDTSVTSTMSKIGMNSNENTDSDSLKSLKKTKTNLIELITSHNFLTILRNYTFFRLHKLQRLDLSFNTIVSMELECFFGLTRLEHLNLRGNHLSQVPAQAFYGLTRSLSYSTGQTYSLNPALKILDLSQNTLISIDTEAFSALDRLQELHINQCSIQFMNDFAFKGLKALQLLTLEENRLVDFSSAAWSELYSLKILKLSANAVRHLKADSFSDLSNLEELQINNSSLTSINPDAFRGLHSLKKLELSRNSNLMHIHPGTFSQLKNLHYLNLYANSLTSLDDSFTFGHNLLNVIDLRDNALDCNCELKWLTKWLMKFNQTIDQAKDADMSQLTQLTCDKPPALAGKLIAELPNNELECLSPTSELNVNVGFGMLFIMTLILTTTCVVGFCRNEKQFVGIVKENLAPDLKKNPPIECADYDGGPVYSIPADQSLFYESTHQM